MAKVKATDPVPAVPAAAARTKPAPSRASAQPAPPIPPLHVPPLFRRVDWLTFGLGFLIVMVGYYYTLAPDLTLEDSGELAVGSFYAGIPHPPGYPVWTIYTWLWANFLPFNNIAWRVALGEAFSGALACGFLGLMVSRGSSMLMEGLEELKEMTGRWEAGICVVSGVVAAGLMGFNGYMWSQSVIVEVYSFSVLSLMLTLTLLMRWVYAPHQYRYLYWSMFLFGICFTNHQSLLVAAMGLEVAIAAAKPRLGREIFLGNVLVYLLVLVAKGMGYVSTFDSAPGQLNMMFVIFNFVGLGSIIAYVMLAIKTAEFFQPRLFLIVILCGVAFMIGAALYLYMPIAGMSNPPMQWGYPRTVEGFWHALTRGQYEKANPTNFITDPLRFVTQLQMMIEGVAAEFSWVFMFVALVPFFYIFRMKQRERAWLIGLGAIYLCLGVLLLILLNPPADRAARELVRVFFTASHTCIAMLVGYGLTLTAAYMATHYQRFRLWGLVGGAVAVVLALFSVRERVTSTLYGEGANIGLGQAMTGVAAVFQPGQFGLPVFSALILLTMCVVFIVALLLYRQRAPLAIVLAVFAALPATSFLANWADNEQRGHLFGYWFGHDMFTPPFDGKEGKPLYPEMTRNAILYGGTDPGRFCPTYVIFCESFIPAKCKPLDPKFDRRDVYIITQNALADGTYLNYIRAHYNKSEQVKYDSPFFSELFRTARQRDEGRTNALGKLLSPLDALFLTIGDRIEKSRRAGSSMFEPESFTNLKDLANRLRTGGEPAVLSRYLVENLSPDTKKLLDQGTDSPALAKALARDFNRLIERDLTLAGEVADLTSEKLELEMSWLTKTPTDKEKARAEQLGEEVAALQKAGNFYSPERFAGVEMSEHLKRFVAENPWTWNRIRMNRLLLEAAYPQAIAKSLGGVYPDLEMYISTPEASQRCFQEYLKDAERRARHDQEHPNEPRQLKPGEEVRVVTGPDGQQRVQVSGQVAVMSINGLLTKDMFDKNPDNEFFVEESFPLDWMFPHLTPFGVIMKINRQPLPELSDEICQRDHEFWAQFSKRLIGDWITYDTPVKEITDFARRTYLQHNYKDFKGDRKFARDDQAQKAFSKLRSSIGGLYAWRLGLMSGAPTPPQYLPKNNAEQQRMLKEAEFAFKQALAFCPYSPEAVFRYVQLLLALNRVSDALLIAETCLSLDPYNGQVEGLVNSLRGATNQPGAYRAPALPTAQSAAAAAQQAAAALTQMEQAWKARPNDLQAGFNLAAAYLGSQKNEQAVQVLDQIANHPAVDVQALLTVARAYADIGQVGRLEPILEKASKVDPGQAEVWYDLAALRAMTGKKAESFPALAQAVTLSTARRATNAGAHDLREEAMKDKRFDVIRQDPEFQQALKGK
jgi:tetratricopeptide (TPR) repeat protein